jgi:hypothetical protein
VGDRLATKTRVLASSTAALILAVSARSSAQPAPPPDPPYAPPAPAAYPTYAYPYPTPGQHVRYDPNAAPPPGYHLEQNPRKGLLVAGAFTFALPYVISVSIALVGRNESETWLLIPVAGPIGALATKRYECNRDDSLECAGNIMATLGLAFDLAAQTAGATLFTTAFVFPKREWISDYEVSRRTTPLVAWSITPRIDAAGRLGVVLRGTIF